MFNKKEFFEALIPFLETLNTEIDWYNTIAPKQTAMPYGIAILNKKTSTEFMNGDTEIVNLDLNFNLTVQRDTYYIVDEVVELIDKSIWNLSLNGFYLAKNKMEVTYSQDEENYTAFLNLVVELEA